MVKGLEWRWSRSCCEDIMIQNRNSTEKERVVQKEWLSYKKKNDFLHTTISDRIQRVDDALHTSRFNCVQL